MTFISRGRVVSVIVAASCIAVPASAAADTLPATYQSDAAQSGSSAAQSTDRTDAAQSGSSGSVQQSTGRTDAAQGGWGGADAAPFPAVDFRGGDHPVDHPGASRAPAAAPTTIEVVRPERTIVRDVDEVLPIVLSSTALMLVLAGLGVLLVRGGFVPRVRRTH
jgi:hypothetical protein